MTSAAMSDAPYTIGVIGSGRFGTAVANLLAENHDVLLYSRNPETIRAVNEGRHAKGHDMHERVTATDDLHRVVRACPLLFPVVPSDDFRTMLREVCPLLTPAHVLIHGTKGLHIDQVFTDGLELRKEDVLTMSELIVRETPVVRVGVVAGPNLASELAEHQPAAAVIASDFDEVIDLGMSALASQRFQVYGSREIGGVELAGVLKNYIAIASGMLTGLGYGDNARALLITRGMAEMIYIARTLGIAEKAFLGIAGVGDLIATCNSELSRNFRVGLGLAAGRSLADIVEEIGEVAEGVKTLRIIKALSTYGFQAPLAAAMHKVVFEEAPIDRMVPFLMRTTGMTDADYIDA